MENASYGLGWRSMKLENDKVERASVVGVPTITICQSDTGGIAMPIVGFRDGHGTQRYQEWLQFKRRLEARAHGRLEFPARCGRWDDWDVAD
jgi:hypothetical protein